MADFGPAAVPERLLSAVRFLMSGGSAADAGDRGQQSSAVGRTRPPAHNLAIQAGWSGSSTRFFSSSSVSLRSVGEIHLPAVGSPFPPVRIPPGGGGLETAKQPCAL
ncbi:hypothetical protein GN956_G23150 [Arapaima gigas]